MIVKLPNNLAVHAIRRQNTLAVYREIFEDGVYAACLNRLPKLPVVFDVGANIGLFSLWLRRHRPHASIHCFEPAPEPYACLTANAREFGRNQWALNKVALGPRDGYATLSYYPRLCEISTFDNWHRKDEEDAVRDYIAEYIPQWIPGRQWFAERVRRWYMDYIVPTPCKMQRFADFHRSEHIDLVKVDVEKSEDGVLAGIDRWDLIDQILVETHLGKPQTYRIADLLGAYGFDVSVRPNHMLHECMIVHGQRS